jgi:two-component system response regulator HydG
VIPIIIPPLRDRAEDIPLLANHFISKYCQRNDSELKILTPEALETLQKYFWPGNVRELENCIERAVLLSRNDKIDVDDFPIKIKEGRKIGVVSEEAPETPTLESIEKAYIYYIMDQTEGKKSRAAKLLGIDNSTLYRKLQRYEIEKKKEKNRS